MVHLATADDIKNINQQLIYGQALLQVLLQLKMFLLKLSQFVIRHQDAVSFKIESRFVKDK